ncbi:hypothetical protein [Haloarcula argentinensis]|uniref:Uncharacterized protein n=1 Tax=Haloarcula argentinensis TaxID=43776 RepID=A0A830FTS9_HALAR|nr:hypothetical protein [Haloarcula argentinensis]GGM37227.1 hypothetical protein GCM10009006_17970 [Haloarcula argentinensis]
MIKSTVQFLERAELEYPFSIWRSKLTGGSILIPLSIVLVGTGTFFQSSIIVLLGFFVAVSSFCSLLFLIYLELSYVFPLDEKEESEEEEEDEEENEEQEEGEEGEEGERITQTV